MKKIIFFLISALIGIELFAGIVIAPTIFFPQKYGLNVPLTLFESGLLMTRIFVILGYILFSISLISLLYALIQKNRIFLLSMLIIVSLASLFVFYFTPFVLESQALGELATQNEQFAQMHTYSQWCLKAIVIFQFIGLILLAQGERR
ncbi:membrane protein [Helicobacter pametensis]|nr:membrane protein [Helicobacter pametensis]